MAPVGAGDQPAIKEDAMTELTLDERYLNLALINMGEALTEFGNVRQRSGLPGPGGGNYVNVRLALLRTLSALDATPWVPPEPAPQHRKDPPPPPEQQSTWRHTSGRYYTVLHIANVPDDEQYPLTVVYHDMANEVWTRRANDWHRSMTLVVAPPPSVDEGFSGGI
jgi:hypothetical protein